MFFVVVTIKVNRYYIIRFETAAWDKTVRMKSKNSTSSAIIRLDR
jgi:hypothetical protein